MPTKEDSAPDDGVSPAMLTSPEKYALLFFSMDSRWNYADVYFVSACSLARLIKLARSIYHNCATKRESVCVWICMKLKQWGHMPTAGACAYPSIKRPRPLANKRLGPELVERTQVPVLKRAKRAVRSCEQRRAVRVHARSVHCSAARVPDARYIGLRVE